MIGFQSNFILPKKDFVLFFRYYVQYRALATVKGARLFSEDRGHSNSQKRGRPSLHLVEGRGLKLAGRGGKISALGVGDYSVFQMPHWPALLVCSEERSWAGERALLP